MNLQNIIKNHYYIFIILFFICVPLNYIPNFWDGVVEDYAFTINDLRGVENYYKEASRHSHLLFIYLVDFLSKKTSLHPEIFMDNFTVLFLFIFCYEVKKYSNLFFSLDSKWSNLAAAFTAIFPVWHTLIVYRLGLYLLFFYFVLIGYRYFIKKKIYHKIVGFLLIVISFGMNSNLSFVIGLVTVHFFICKFKNENDCQLKDVIFIIAIAISSYLINNHFFPPYGLYEGYNTPYLLNLFSFNLLNNIFIFSIYFLHCAWIPIAYVFSVLLLKKEKKLNFKLSYNYLFLIVLAAFAVGPYLLVNRAPLFIFSEYFQRHAYLLGPIFGIFFATLFKDISSISTLENKKILKFFIIIFIFQNLLLLSYGHYKKIERYVYQENLIKELKNHGKIPKGNVKIISNNYPATLRNYETSFLFYKAYGSASWYGNIVKNNEDDLKWLKLLLSKEEYRLNNIIKDYVYECSSSIFLKNDLNRLQRIKKSYIFNSSKFFNIEKVTYDCEEDILK